MEEVGGVRIGKADAILHADRMRLERCDLNRLVSTNRRDSGRCAIGGIDAGPPGVCLPLGRNNCGISG